MSVTSIQQSALYRFAQAPDNLRFVDDFYAAINDSQNEFCALRSWGFLRTKTSLSAVHATRTVSLPTDFGTPYNVPGGIVITTTAYAGDVITLMPYEQWIADEWEAGTTEGEPTYAYILGDYIYLSPIPDAAYTFDFPYYKKATEIEDSSDSLTIPARYEEVLKKMIWKRLQDAGYSAVQEMQISDADVQRLLSNYTKDDIKKYGGMVFNLSSTTYTRETN